MIDLESTLDKKHGFFMGDVVKVIEGLDNVAKVKERTYDLINDGMIIPTIPKGDGARYTFFSVDDIVAIRWYFRICSKGIIIRGIVPFLRVMQKKYRMASSKHKFYFCTDMHKNHMMLSRDKLMELMANEKQNIDFMVVSNLYEMKKEILHKLIELGYWTADHKEYEVVHGIKFWTKENMK